MSLPPKHKPRSEDANVERDSNRALGKPARLERGSTDIPCRNRKSADSRPQAGAQANPVHVSGTDGNARRIGPPKVHPKTLAKQFAADVFDKTMREPGPDGPLVHTDLGMLVETWHWYRTHMVSCGDAFQPIANSIYDHLQRKCPKVVEDVRRIAGGELTNQRKQ